MTKQNNTAPLFTLFWENTKLNDKNILNFVGGFENEETDESGGIKYPTLDAKLKYPKDRLFKTMAARKSGRDYQGCPLTERQLSSLFSCFSKINGQRLLPSAGGKYPIEVYALCFNVEGKLNGKAVYYDCHQHALSIVGHCGTWQGMEKFTSNNGIIKGAPAIMFVFVGFPGRVVSKYGERGGRFLLIEAGHYLQNLSLRVTHEKLNGVELGGLYDDVIKKCLGLGHTDAMIILGFLCGK